MINKINTNLEKLNTFKVKATAKKIITVYKIEDIIYIWKKATKKKFLF